jgi:gliding motility-associated-like protein
MLKTYILHRSFSIIALCCFLAVPSVTSAWPVSNLPLDNAGLKQQCPPVFQNVPANVTVECDQVPPVANNVTASSCCPISSISFSEIKDIGTICGDDYTLIREWLATDECGNTAKTTQLVKVVDTTPPFFINPPGDISGECNPIPPIPAIQASDNCDNNVFSLLVETQLPGPCFGTYNLTRLWVIRDNCDNANFHVQVVTIKDVGGPTFTLVPPNLTVSCNDPIPQAVPGVHVKAIDACNPDVIITQSETQTPGVCPVFYTITRIFTANDGCGNTVTATQTISVRDDSPPVINNVPANITVTCNAPQPAGPSASDNCDNNPDLTVHDEILSGGGCGQDVLLRRIWTATDGCGNTSTASQLVTVKIMGDIEFHNVPADVSSACNAIPNPANVNAADACGLPLAVNLSENIVQGGCPQSYLLVRTWTASDPCGNTASTQQLITVTDNNSPSISAMPMDVTVECGNIPNPAAVTASDACDPAPNLQFSETIQGDVCDPQVITRTWIAEDACGNTKQVIQNIFVKDDQPPVILNPPADLTISCSLMPPAIPMLQVVDDCGNGNVDIKYQEFINGQVCDPQMLGRVWTVTDQCGNSVILAQMITILDDAPPVIIPPADITVDCADVPNLEEPFINDDCDSDPDIVYTEMSTPGNCPIAYTLMRRWKVTDQCGNMATATQNVVVIDALPPVIEFIHPLLVGLQDGDTFKIACDKPVIFDLEDVSVTDNCDPDPELWMEEELIEVGPCVIFMLCTFVAQDECGNISTLSFYYLIGDDEPPVLVGVPADLTLECDQPVPPPANVTATDNCTKNITVTYSQVTIPGSCPENYMIIRTWSAEDECGNKVTKSQKLTIRDTKPPVWMPMHPILVVFTSGDTLFFECDGTVLLEADDLLAKDNCDQDVTKTFVEEIVTGDCTTDGYIIKMVCTWTATDNCGNSTTFVVVAIITDKTPPVISMTPKDLTLSCEQPLPILPTVTAFDNCDGEVPVNFTSQNLPGSCPQEYMMINSWSATDACGNLAQKSQKITIVDHTAPLFTLVPENITIECDETVPAGQPLATDNCDMNVTITSAEKTATGNCIGSYLILREWTATDDCGNQSTTLQIITVEDTTPPLLLGFPADVTVECSNVPAPANVKAADNCDPNVDAILAEQRVNDNCLNNYTLLRTWTATDDCGNQVIRTQKITVRDTQAPVLAGIPANITLECDQPIPTPPVVNAQDNCDNNPTVSLVVVTLPGNCPEAYVLVRTWTAADACGNSSTGSQTITVRDSKAPVFVNIPPTLELECSDPIPSQQPEVKDNCDNNPQLTLEETTIPGQCEQEYTLIRVWTAEDNCGNRATAQQVIKVKDTTPPVIMTLHPELSTISSGDTIYFECDDAIIYDVDDVKATDNCDPNPLVTFDEIVTEGDCIQDGFILQMRCTWTATDDCGNSNSFYIVVRIVDTTPPVLHNVPANVTIECDQPLPGTSVVMASDNCTENVTITVAEQIAIGNCKQNYTITRTWTATDDCGNTATAQQKIKVQDTTAPEIVGVPDDLTIECDQPLPNPANVTATDNCDPNPTLEFKEARQDGNCPQEYILLRIWQAEDDCGNVATVTQKITVVDTKAPILLGVPSDVTVECSNVPTPANVKAADNCDLVVDVVYDQQRINGNCLYNYVLIRTWTATDDCGNEVVGTQKITVRDTQAPVLAGIPANITLECDQPIPTPPVVNAQDNCDNNPTVSLAVVTLPGNCPEAYVLVRTWTATDACGNSSTGLQTITVRDTKAPVFVNVPPTLELECSDPIPSQQPGVKDNCDNNPQVTLEETTIPGQCEQEYTLIRVWTAEDNCGNSATAQQVIKVKDTTPPVIMTLHPELSTISSGDTIYFECDDAIIYDVDDVKATDNCDPNPLVSFDEIVTQGDCIQDGFILQMRCTWTATDDCGNSSSFYIVVRIVDTTPPVLHNVPANVTIECDQPLPGTSVVTASDNCTENVTITVAEQIAIGNCKQNYTITRTWTATDDCGNTATAQQKIKVQDTTAPEIIGVPDDLTIECDQPLPNPANVTATDNCDPNPTLEFKEARQDGNCPQEYILLRIWQAEDDCGNVATVTQKITVVDTKAPILLGIPSDVTVECSNVPTPANVKAADNCDLVVDVVYDQQRINGNCLYNYVLIRTWTATDDCGNEVVGTQKITVRDTQAPVFSQLPNDLTIACDLPWPVVDYEAVDNCSSVISEQITIEGGKPCDNILDRRIIKIMDECGNEATAIQNILLIDTVPPVFKPFDQKIVVSCDEIHDFPEPEAMDNCDDDVAISLHETKVPGKCPQEYTLLRIFTATDDCGNTSSAVQLIGVVDNEAPILIPNDPILVGLPNDTTLEFDCAEAPALGEDAFTADDNCDEFPVITFKEEIEQGNCAADGYYLLMVCTWTATDACGNASTFRITVKITDNEAPVFTNVPANVTITCEDPLPSEEPTTSDNCASTISMTENDVQTDLDCGYLITRTWTAVDECGNSATTHQLIRVTDIVAPYFTTSVTDITVDLDLGQQIPTPPSVTASDDCSDWTVSYTSTEQPGADCGTIINRLWIATDDCGNTAALTQKVTVKHACPCVLPEIDTVIVQNPDCGDANGVINVITVNDPTLYDYIWIPAKGQGNAVGNIRSGLSKGQYSILVQDPKASNCFTKLNVTLVEEGTCVDTVYVNIPINDPYTACLEEVLDFGGDVVSAEICGQDANEVGVIVQPGSPCVLLLPAQGFTGSAEVCVIHCNDEVPEVCDTTYIFITINALQPCDPVFSNSVYNLNLPNCTDEAKICLMISPSLVSEYQILIDGAAYAGQVTPCGPNTVGIQLGVGQFDLEITHIPTQCFDSRIITVTCSEEELIAVDDTTKTRKNQVIQIPVLFNDIVPTGQSIEAFDITKQPIHGRVEVQSNLNVLYFPDNDFCGKDSFEYRICTDPETCDNAMVTIDVLCQGLIVHTGMSPNDDNINDNFTIDGIEDYPKNELTIFNRWGNQVYFQKGYKNNWSGTWDGGLLPDGTYFYFLKDGEGETYSGFLQIHR